MSVMQASQEARGGETSSGEHGKREGLAEMAVQSDKKTRGTVRATAYPKLARPANRDCVWHGAAGEGMLGGSGVGKPPGTPEKSGGNGHADVKSVAELAVVICEDANNRKKRLKVAEALRERGLDESKLAAMYSGVAEKLSRNKEAGAVGVAAAKLLFDVLKELTHWLEPQKNAGDSDASEAPQFVRLIHNVPRPVRTE